MITMLTCWSEEYAPLAKITQEGKIKYAIKHGYLSQDRFHPTKNIAWDRPIRWLEILSSLPEDEWMFFTGADVILTNHSIKLENLIDKTKDFICASDCDQPQSDSWLMRNCPRTRRFLGRVISYEGKVNDEQEAICVALSRYSNYKDYCEAIQMTGVFTKQVERELNGSDVKVKVISQKLINAYALEHYDFPIQNDGSKWELGDFVAHLPCKSMEYRMEHLKKMLIDSKAWIEA